MIDVIQLLRDLVAIPSVNPSDREPDEEVYGEERMVDHLEEFFRREGIDCVRQEALPGRENLIARVQGKSRDCTILEAHTDTVAVDGMSIEPFEPRLENGRVYGRGACDDKASLAAMMTALVEVARRGAPEKTCVLAATCDEEYRFSGVKSLLAAPESAGIERDQLRSAVACVGEPTGLAVVIAHKGAFRWRVRTRGKAAHSSRPDEGDNAIYKMARLIGVLEEYAESLRDRPKHPLVGGPTFAVGVIRGGSAPNIVPDFCEILTDRRLIPGEDGKAAEREIREFLGDRVEYEMEMLLEDWPMETRRDAQIVLRAEAAAQAVLGAADIIGVQYGTDASKMAREGIECVVCGPGDIAQAHTAEEWVEVSQVEAAVGVYERVLEG